MHSSARWRDCTSFLSLPYRHWWQSWPSLTLPIKHKTNSLITATYKQFHQREAERVKVFESWNTSMRPSKWHNFHFSHVVSCGCCKAEQIRTTLFEGRCDSTNPELAPGVSDDPVFGPVLCDAPACHWDDVIRHRQNVKFSKNPSSYASRPLVAIIAQLQHRENKETVLTQLQSSVVLTKSSWNLIKAYLI